MGRAIRRFLSDLYVAAHGVVLVLLSVTSFIVALGIVMALVRVVLG
ncbi:MAG: hypothetical protein HFJ75_01380 [Eggerthellaceae bacterium]|nr:hypothetical protein [Eggerthellaceae bacterium]